MSGPLLPRHLAGRRPSDGGRPHGVGTTVDNGCRNVHAVRTTPAVHLPAAALRMPAGVSSTGARFFGTSVSGTTRASSPASTAAKTTDENLKIRTGNDQNCQSVDHVDGAEG
jgi:hypothetical protein